MSTHCESCGCDLESSWAWHLCRSCLGGLGISRESSESLGTSEVEDPPPHDGADRGEAEPPAEGSL